MPKPPRQAHGRPDSYEHAHAQVSERISSLARHYQLRNRNRICRHGITVAQCYALEAVVETGGLLVTELGRALAVDKSSASRVAESLMDQKLASVEDVPGNDRKKRIVATPAGRRLAARIAREVQREHRAALDRFTRAEIETCSRMLEALLPASNAAPARRRR